MSLNCKLHDTFQLYQLFDINQPSELGNKLLTCDHFKKDTPHSPHVSRKVALYLLVAQHCTCPTARKKMHKKRLEPSISCIQLTQGSPLLQKDWKLAGSAHLACKQGLRLYLNSLPKIYKVAYGGQWQDGKNQQFKLQS